MSTRELPGPKGEPLRGPRLGEPAAPAEGFDGEFERDGYVVVPGLVEPERVAALRRAVDEELRPSKALFWRQTTGRPERHAPHAQGFIDPPLQHLQDLRERDFPAFRPAALDVLTAPGLRRALERLMGEPPVLVQSMLFEANPQTPPHQDAYYLDSMREGSLIAAWVALEDIPEEAGRFFACPGSHRRELARNEGEHLGAFHHERYLALVREELERGRWEVHAPALRAGDVLFWGSRTVHGSLPTLDPACSRLSVTAHYIPASTGFLRMQAVEAALDPEAVNGMVVSRQRPQDRLRWRLMLQLAGRAPGLLRLGRRVAARLRGR